MTSAPTTNALYRRVLLQAHAGQCVAAVEDDFHHFIVTVRHDGQVVTDVQAQGLRTPWSLCAQAAELLPQLVGVPLRERTLLQLPSVDSKQQCTHQFDMAVLALSHALRSGQREYLLTVTDPQDKQQQAQLWRDGQLLLNWQLHRTAITSNDVFNGQDLRGLMPWAEAQLDNDKLEALYVLRRAVMVSGGRIAKLSPFQNQLKNAGQAMVRMAGACYVFQPGRAEQAQLSPDSIRVDLQDHSDLLTTFGPPAAIS